MCTCVHHPHTVGLMVFSYVHHPHRKLWWYFSFVCVCVLSVQHITYVRVSGDDLTYHVKEISPLFIQVLYTLQWRVSTREVATEPNANTKATQNKQKKGGKVDKVFILFYFILFYFSQEI